MVLRPRYRSAGMLALPYFLVVEALAPILEIIGLIAAVALTALTGGAVDHGAGSRSVWPIWPGSCASFLVLTLDDVAFGTFHASRDRLVMVGHVLFEQAGLPTPDPGLAAVGAGSCSSRGARSGGSQERRGLGDEGDGRLSRVRSRGPIGRRRGSEWPTCGQDRFEGDRCDGSVIRMLSACPAGWAPAPPDRLWWRRGHAVPVETMIEFEAAWQCDVTRYSFADSEAIEAKRDEVMAGYGVEADRITPTFTALLDDDDELREDGGRTDRRCAVRSPTDEVVDQ